MQSFEDVTGQPVDKTPTRAEIIEQNETVRKEFTAWFKALTKRLRAMKGNNSFQQIGTELIDHWDERDSLGMDFYVYFPHMPRVSQHEDGPEGINALGVVVHRPRSEGRETLNCSHLHFWFDPQHFEEDGDDGKSPLHVSITRSDKSTDEVGFDAGFHQTALPEGIIKLETLTSIVEDYIDSELKRAVQLEAKLHKTSRLKNPAKNLTI